MHVLAPLLFLLPTAFAAQHIVEAGEDGKLQFVPDTLQAAVGDTVVFVFYPGGHSVAQSTFDNPCNPSSGGIWSGFFSTSSGKDPNVWVVTLNDTNPIWIYCAQSGHCIAGMAMVINPPSGGNNLAAYKSAAANAQDVVPQKVEGGVVTAGSAVTSGASSTSTSAPKSSAAPIATSTTAATTTATTEATTGTGSPSASAISAGSASAQATSAPATSATTSASKSASSSPAAFTGASTKNQAVGALVATFGALGAIFGASIFGLGMM